MEQIRRRISLDEFRLSYAADKAPIYSDLVDLLLAHGAEIGARGDDGRTAVSEALRGGHPSLADYLRSKGGRDAAITANVLAAPE